MPTASDYFDVLSKNARREHDAWWLVSERTGTPESRRAKLQATLRYFGQDKKFDALSDALETLPAKSDLSPELRGLLDQLVSDLVDYVRPGDLDLYRKIHFGMLPLSSVDGFCVNRTLTGEQLDGYLVVINEGLWVCAQLLAKAFVLENLGGDFEEFKRSGRADFDAALSHYLSPSVINAQKVFFESVPPDVEGALSAAQSSMAILIMQFVVMHEVGHVVGQDFDLLGAYRLHLDHAFDGPPVATDQHWVAEYAADAYSLQAICEQSGTDVSRWANFITVYVFFNWLARIEAVLRRSLCPLHPPPSERGERLLQWMLARYPGASESREFLTQTRSILATWSA